MSKIIVSILAYNSETFIKYTLDSIYDLADKIVIVEGAYGLQRAFGLRSSDRTIEIIKDYPDPKKKILLIFKNAKEHEHRNEVLKFCEPGDWFFTVHTDEIYKKMDLANLREILSSDRDTDVFKVPWFEFYYNFHLGIDGTDSSQRIYRIREGCKFFRKDQLATKDGTKYGDMNINSLDRNKVLMFHYAYIYNVKKKIHYYGEKAMIWYNEIFRKFTPENADYIYKKNMGLNGGYGIHLNGDPVILSEFHGEHPEAMKTHPLATRDLIELFKNGYEEPDYNEGNILNKLATALKYRYYKYLGNT